MTGKAVFRTNITSGSTLGIACLFDGLCYAILRNSAFNNSFKIPAQDNETGMSYVKFKIVKLDYAIIGRLRKMNFNGINI